MSDKQLYAPRQAHRQSLYLLLLDHLETWLARQDFIRLGVAKVLADLMTCGIERYGLAKLRCLSCGDEAFLPLSCRRRGICISCHARRQLLAVEKILNQVLADVSYRQWTYSLPKILRAPFGYDEDLFKAVTVVVVDALTIFSRHQTGIKDLEPGFVVVDQTFGILPDDFHPHLHLCATDGGFTKDKKFVPLGKVSQKDLFHLEEVLRHKTLSLFEKRRRLNSQTKEMMLSWEHSGFSLDASRRIPAGDRNGLESPSPRLR